MFVHARVCIHHRIKLEQAIRDVFGTETPASNEDDIVVQLVVGKLGVDKFLLTPAQITELKLSKIATIDCTRSQIMNYAHSCIRETELVRILNSKDPL